MNSLLPIRIPGRGFCGAIFLLGLTGVALANPKVLNGLVLKTEQVDVKIQGERATVSGEFRYHQLRMYARSNELGDVRVFFPLVGPKGRTLTLADFNFALTLNGAKPIAYSLDSKPPLDRPANDLYSVVWVVATFADRPGRMWHLQVSYEQDLIEDRLYYLPILEQKRRGRQDLRVTVRADRPIRSESSGPGGMLVLAPNTVRFQPVHLGMIVVSAAPVR